MQTIHIKNFGVNLQMPDDASEEDILKAVEAVAKEYGPQITPQIPKPDQVVVPTVDPVVEPVSIQDFPPLIDTGLDPTRVAPGTYTPSQRQEPVPVPPATELPPPVDTGFDPTQVDPSAPIYDPNLIRPTPLEEDPWLEVLGKSALQGATSPVKAIGAGALVLEKATGLTRGGLYEKAQLAERYWAPKVGNNRAKQIVNQTINSLAIMGVSALAGSGKLLPILAGGAGLIKAGEAIEEGATLPRAAAAGATQAAVEYLTEMIPIGTLRAPGLSFISRLVTGAIADIPGELIATATEMRLIDEEILGKPRYTKEEYTRALTDTLAVAGLTTLGATVVSSTIQTPDTDVSPITPEIKDAPEIDDTTVEAMFQRGEERIREAAIDKPTSVMKELQIDLTQMNAPLYRKVNQAKKIGIEVPDAINPIFWTEELPYLSSEYGQYLRDIRTELFDPMEAAGVNVQDIGVWQFLTRVKGERKDIANPLGFTGKTAEKELQLMKKKWGPKKTTQIQKAAEKFWELRQKNIIPVLKQSEMFSDEMMAKIENNQEYVTFDVQDMIEERFGKNIGAKIYHQIGTLEDINNPFMATLMKDAALLRTANTKIIKKTTVDFYKTNFPDEIKQADTRFNGHFKTVEESTDPELGLIAYLDNGQALGYYLPKDIARSFSARPYDAGIVIRSMEKMTAPLKEILVGKNVPWALWNIQKDAKAVVKQIPGANVRKVVKYLIASVPDAWEDVFNNMSTEDVRWLYKNRVISFERQFRPIDDAPETQVDRLMMSYGMSKKKYENNVAKPFIKLWNALDKPGKFSERLSKIASYKLLKTEHPEWSDKKIAHLIRTRGGSPDFLSGGMYRRVYNSLFLFSNVGIRGVASAVETAKENPASYARKTMQLDIMPKLLMYLAVTGGLGHGVKELMDRIPERDKENYITIPLMMTPNGKTVYLVQPHDFQGQLAAGLMWEALRTKKTEDITNLLDYISGEIPYSNLNPWISTGIDIVQYLTGKNPYNEWAGRSVIPEGAFTANDDRARLIMMKHIWNSMGGSVVYRAKTNDIGGIKSEVEKILGFPLTESFVRRFLRVSDWGIRETLRGVKSGEKERRAREILDTREAIIKVINKKKLTTKDIKLMSENPDIVDVTTKAYFMRIYGDAFVNEYLNARTVRERVVVLNKIKELKQ